MKCCSILLISLCLATHMIPIDPRSKVSFLKTVEEDGLQFRARVDVNNQANVVFRVYEPEEQNIPDEEFDMSQNGFEQFSLAKDYFYRKKGTYLIRIYNLSPYPVLATVKASVDKPYGADDVYRELRQSLVELDDKLDYTYRLNRKLKEHKEAHIKEAKRALKKLLVLCVLPLFYVAIGAIKLKRMKMFFQPKK